jgi:predicted trehalose synthase
MSLPDRITGPLEEWVVGRRWFGSKAREVHGVTELERVTLGTDPALDLVFAEARFGAGTHETYQLLPGEPGAERVLGALLDRNARVDGVRFHSTVDVGGPVRPIGAEQSNSSVIFDDAHVLKVFRRLDAGDNPELEMLRFLSDHGFANIAPLTGWYEYSGELMDATLGVLQAYVPEARDGWELALDDPHGVLHRLGELGTATGRMHSVLGSESEDPHFFPETPGDEAISLITATIDEQIERVFVDLPDHPALAGITGRAEEVRDRLQMLSHVGVGGRLIRHHGDLHLGQTLLTDEKWVILDFEGEPARPIRERRRKRSPLRDVAGMLRSFAYAASAAELLRGRPAPGGWEEEARRRFLDAYFDAVDPALMPAGQAAIDKLLAIFELEKAIYELRYELNNRPDWVGIPAAGIERLLRGAVEA